MTEQSPQLNTASPKGTPESLSRTRPDPQNEPQPIGANIQKIWESLRARYSDDQHIAEVDAIRRSAEDRKLDNRVCGYLGQSCLPRRHMHAGIIQTGPVRDPQADPWADKLQMILGMTGKGTLIALIGPRGTGKTQMAVTAAVHWCEQDHSILYKTAMDIFIALKESYRSDGPTESAQLSRFYEPSLLIIDEAQVRSESAWENNMLTHLIDTRYMRERDTLIISNQTPSAFRASIGESIYSRLLETGYIVECDWPSFRKPIVRLGIPYGTYGK